MNTVKKDTIIRTIVLIVALINQAFTLSGKNPLPFEDDEIVNVLSYAFTAAASLWAWWKNNSFTENAIKADKVLDALNSGETEVVVK